MKNVLLTYPWGTLNKFVCVSEEKIKKVYRKGIIKIKQQIPFKFSC